MRIEEIINKEIKVVPNLKNPELIEIVKPLEQQSKMVYLRYEVEVFNYLYEHKTELGISKIYKLRNSSADGILRLDNDKMVLLEIKYSLGWDKSSVARIQFQWFMKRQIYKMLSLDKPNNALIIFDHFSADFAKTQSQSDIEVGWYGFYIEEMLINNGNIKTDIVKLSDGILTCYQDLHG